MARLALVLLISAIATTGISQDGRGQTPGADPALEARFTEAADRLEADLVRLVLPYWYDTVDWERGGYLLADDGSDDPPPATDKRLVAQARMVWAFARAHRQGIRDAERDYLAAAENGYRFLLGHMRDPEHGGYLWSTDPLGAPLDDRKFLYGQAFALYALVEYHRASGDAAALRHAVDLFRTIQRHCGDRRFGGWREHFSSDWRPIKEPGESVAIGRAGQKSDNAHLHWMEALEELLTALRRVEPGQRPIKARRVKAALAEALSINATYFYPSEPSQAVAYRARDWSLLDAPGHEISYGHNVEFGWLMIRAQEALRVAPDWPRFDTLLDHALAHGFDHERGGLYRLGIGDLPAHDTAKVWWVQAELLAALAVRLAYAEQPDYAAALDRLLSFLQTYQIDPKDGIWWDTVSATGEPLRPGKAHGWKAAYHDLRAVVKFIDTFSTPDAPPHDPAGGR